MVLPPFPTWLSPSAGSHSPSSQSSTFDFWLEVHPPLSIDMLDEIDTIKVMSLSSENDLLASSLWLLLAPLVSR